ncbi:Nse1 non-SMC component of SMC5-6 complex-domain-containing protein [Podospora fimiseda]|uniref:Non-structural maintenance of chromosomes element 1 homolog n=1 Tax=Podospora fimiseda TaxID=252190 RepID=A0AAN7BMR1_9PEZI|nr:Nse1 non-SMC component of SMC5-6 complex-domain-containing protein [Podospora fimiseda]
MEDWEPPLPIGYNDHNRAFLQAFMARGTLTFSEAQNLIGEIQGVDPQSLTMDQFINVIRTSREAVEPLDFDIRNTRRQTGNGERVWAFINAHSDPATMLATIRSPEEVSYIKRLFDAMFETYNTPRMEVMAVDEAQALKVSRPPRDRESAAHTQQNGENGDGSQAAVDRGLKHSEVLTLLTSLVDEGWLEKSQQGFFTLSPRSLIELWSWLVATYNDPDLEEDWQHIKFCEACKEIVTDGQRCSNADCTIRLHDICEGGFWRTKPDRKCPKCSTPWDGNHFVGERAVTSRSGFRRSKGGRRSGARQSNANGDADGNEEDDE